MQDVSLKEALDYDPKTGKIFWKITRSRAVKGREAGCMTGEGYRQVKFAGEIYHSSRLAWYLFWGSFPPCAIFQRDGNRANNVIENLVLASERKPTLRLVSKNEIRPQPIAPNIESESSFQDLLSELVAVNLKLSESILQLGSIQKKILEYQLAKFAS